MPGRERLRPGGLRRRLYASALVFALAGCFSIDGIFHTISCGAVRADLVSDEIVAEGSWQGRPIEVRRIAGVDPILLLAASLDGGICAEDDLTPLSPWSMLFVGEHSPAEVHDAVCRAGVDAHRARNGCA